MKYAQTQEFLFFLQKNNCNSSEHSHFTSSYQIFKIPALLASFNLQLFEDYKVFYNSICSTNEYNFAAIWFREDCSMPSWVYFNRTVWLLKSQYIAQHTTQSLPNMLSTFTANMHRLLHIVLPTRVVAIIFLRYLFNDQREIPTET